MAAITAIPEPDIAVPTERPIAPVERFGERLLAARNAMAAEGLDFLVVYGDRERAGDLHYLTGIDPRFEEGVLVVSRDGENMVMLGNENLVRQEDVRPPIQHRLYQEFSPQGQVRDHPVQITALLREAGLEPGAKVGMVGGKSFQSGFVSDPARAFGVPAYLVDAAREIVGDESVINAQQLFVHPNHGLRSVNTAHELAEAEYASAICSASVHAATLAIAVGSRSDQIAARLVDGGVQRSVHAMVNFGDRTRFGVCSPSNQAAELGEAFQVALGLVGALTSRSGTIAHGPNDLPSTSRDLFEALTLNYFDTMVAWWQAIGVGASAGTVFAAADTARDSDLWSFALNPGHTLGFEEWLESPFRAGSDVALRSGLLLQADIIPAHTGPVVGVNIEDGLALADTALRAELADAYPQAYARIEQRRRYLSEVIGVQLDESVLPLSNTPLWHAPYILDPSVGLVNA